MSEMSNSIFFRLTSANVALAGLMVVLDVPAALGFLVAYWMAWAVLGIWKGI